MSIAAVLAVSDDGGDKVLPVLVRAGTVGIQVIWRITEAGSLTARRVIRIRRCPLRRPRKRVQHICVVRFCICQPKIQLRPIVNPRGGIDIVPLDAGVPQPHSAERNDRPRLACDHAAVHLHAKILPRNLSLRG